MFILLKVTICGWQGFSSRPGLPSLLRGTPCSQNVTLSSSVSVTLMTLEMLAKSSDASSDCLMTRSRVFWSNLKMWCYVLWSWLYLWSFGVNTMWAWPWYITSRGTGEPWKIHWKYITIAQDIRHDMCVASQQTLILQEVYCGWDGDDSGVISMELISSLPTSCLARTTTLVSTQHIYDRIEQQPRVHIVRWLSKKSRTKWVCK